MNSSERVLDAEVQAPLDEHLDAVERALASAGMSRSERRTVCDEVEAQACEMVWRHAESKPTEQHMKAVLAELDDPEAYREAAEPSGQLGAANTRVARPKVHPFALCAFLIPPAAVVLLVLSPIHPQGGGEVAGFIYFGVVALLSIVFATLAIRDMRRVPDRYFGIALALFGALTVPLLILNTVVVFNVSEINPFGQALIKQKMERNLEEMEQRLRQEHIVRHSLDVPFEPPMLPKDDASVLRMNGTEKWIAEHAPFLPLVTDVVIVGLALVFSALLYVWLYRRCRSRDRGIATGPRIGSC